MPFSKTKKKFSVSLKSCLRDTAHLLKCADDGTDNKNNQEKLRKTKKTNKTKTKLKKTKKTNNKEQFRKNQEK